MNEFDELCKGLQGQRLWDPEENMNNLQQQFRLTQSLLEDYNQASSVVLLHLQTIALRYRQYIGLCLFEQECSHLLPYMEKFVREVSGQAVLDPFTEDLFIDLLLLTFYIDHTTLSRLHI